MRPIHRAFLVAFILAATSSSLRAQDSEAGIALGRTPAAAALEDLNGGPADLSRLVAGMPALIEFWATWCTRCRALEPRLTAAHGRFGTRVRFIAVAVAVNQTAAAVRRHVAGHPMPYPVLWDAKGSAVRAFEAPSTSYIVVLNKAGKVAYTGVGVEQNFEAALDRVVSAN